MKIIILLACFFAATGCFGQSLRDSLFSGKLKVDSALLKKSGMDKMQKPAGDSIVKTANDSTTQGGINASENKNPTGAPKPPVQNSAKTWKQFVDEYTGILNTQVLTTKKVRKGIYSVMIEYEIGTDGVVNTTNVTSTPSSDYLVNEVKEVMMPNAPQLSPVLRNGQPVKVKRRQFLTISKEKN